MYALCDCNNFYASCERVFKPSLNGRPVVVLSNNDGCVIARSQEAKDVGVAMGVPSFEIKELVKEHGIVVFSSNYALYGDLSNRVMSVLGSFAPNYEVYSVDEIFLNFKGMKYTDLTEYCKLIRKTVRQSTKIPISIGIAPTKTLAKTANKIAKKKFKNIGVLELSDPKDIEKHMKEFPVGDLWGIGGRYAHMLKKNNINTAWELMQMNDGWIKKNLTVQGLKLVYELRGIPCIPIEEVAPDKQGICVSRSFGQMIGDLATLEESVATFANRAAQKLRKQGSNCGAISVFVHTNQFRSDLKQYYNSKYVNISIPTNDSGELIKWALEGLRRIYKPGFLFKKAGVLIFEITPETAVQTHLFKALPENDKKKALNATVDKLNKVMGRNVVKYGAMGDGKKWKLKQEMLSPCYTTRLNEIFTINI
ncbi:MAG: Y-family DNA polymerase [Bacteroidia bacterium]